MNARAQFFTPDQIEAAINAAKGDRTDPFGRLSVTAAPAVIRWQMTEINQGTDVGETLLAMLELAGWLIANVAQSAGANGMDGSMQTAIGTAISCAVAFDERGAGVVHEATPGGTA